VGTGRATGRRRTGARRAAGTGRSLRRQRPGEGVQGHDPSGRERREPHAGEEPLALGLVAAGRRDDVRRAVLLRVGRRRGEKHRTYAAAPVVPVDDEGVDRDLGIAEDEGERVRSEDGETDRHLPAGATGSGIGTGEDREDDAMTRVVEQSAESGGGVQTTVPGEDVLRVGVGPVLAHQREDGGQVGRTRRARHHAGPKSRS
jgi:hypothetical protein